MSSSTEQTRTLPAVSPGAIVELATCPGCGAPAEVEWRADLASTDGPVPHAKIRCVRRHHFLLPWDAD